MSSSKVIVHSSGKGISRGFSRHQCGSQKKVPAKPAEDEGRCGCVRVRACVRPPGQVGPSTKGLRSALLEPLLPPRTFWPKARHPVTAPVPRSGVPPSWNDTGSTLQAERNAARQPHRVGSSQELEAGQNLVRHPRRDAPTPHWHPGSQRGLLTAPSPHPLL